MIISVSQLYTTGVSYPFSHRFQVYLSDEITKCVSPSNEYIRKYSADYNIDFILDANTGITTPEVDGPRVFKKYKKVEFIIFLPFDMDDNRGEKVNRRILHLLLDQIVVLLKGFQMEVSELTSKVDALIERIVTDPAMLRSR